MVEQEMTELPRFLGDEPCTDPGRIRFGHDVYVTALRDVVATCPTPFVIGLYGKWGTGKTTVLQGLRSALQKESHEGPTFKVCLFDAWKYSEEASFRRQFLAVLNEQLSLRWDLDSLLYRPKEELSFGARGFSRAVAVTAAVFTGILIILVPVYLLALRLGGVDLASPLLAAASASIITILLFLVGVVFDLVKISTHTVTQPVIFAPEQFEEQFRGMLRKARITNDRRLLVLVDNLDRCAPDAAVSALKTIKTFLEHTGCIFVLACDEDALIRHLTLEKAGVDRAADDREAKEFLRKFFQTTIPVEPLPDDLRDFASELVEAAGLHAHVARVVWAAAPRDPRRILQFLNRLSMALYVVEARERSRRLPPGIVSANQAYLAKIIWLTEHWREFVEDCLMYPELLPLVDEAIVHPDLVNPDAPVAKYVGAGAEKKYRALQRFMEATMPIRADDPLPFLTLQMSSVEMGIADPQSFRDKLREGRAEEIATEIARVTDRAELLKYKEIITRRIEHELDRGRLVDVVPACRVAVRCFDLLPEPRAHLAETVCGVLRNASPQQDIPTFEQACLVKCMREASESVARPATETVLNSLDHTSVHTGELFAALSEHGELLDSAGWVVVQGFLLATLSTAPERALQYLEVVEPESAVATALFREKPDILTQIASKINLGVDLAGKMSDTFGRFREHADEAAMNQLAGSIVALISGPPDARVESYGHRALSALSHLDVAKVSLENINKLHEALHRTMTEPRAHEEIAHFLTHELRIYSMESEGGQQQTLQAVRGFVATWPAEKLSLLGEVIWRAELQPVRNTFVDAAAARASDAQRSKEDIEPVLVALAAIAPDTESLALSSALTRMVESPERPVKELGAKNIATYADRLPPASLQELVKAVHREYMDLPAAESGPMASHLLQLTDKRSPGNIRNTFADRLKTEMVHENPAVRRAAAQHYDELRRRARLSQDTRKTVAQDVADGLYALRQTLAVEDRPLFDLLLEEQDKPKILKGTWTALGNTIESLLHSDHAPPVRHMACQLVTQFHTLPEDLHDGIREQLEMIAADESLPQEIRDDASSAIRGLGEAAE